MERNVSFIEQDHQQEFQISMSNYSIHKETGAVIKSILTSAYSRIIYDVPVENLGFAKYTFSETHYKAREHDEFRKWTFAQNAEFYHSLYYLKDTDYRNKLVEEGAAKPPYPDLEQTFGKYPKLPSVYLLIMQALDIIALDSFLSIVNSHYHSADLTADYVRVSDLSKQSIGIGEGIYAETSYYYNEDFYVRLIGSGCFSQKEYWIFDYYSDPSDIYMKEAKKENAKKSKSLYSGRLFVDKENGELLYGEMDENVIPLGKSGNYTKRKIVLKSQRI